MNIEEKDILKAHQEGCADVRKVLQNLFPKVFEPKPTPIVSPLSEHPTPQEVYNFLKNSGNKIEMQGRQYKEYAGRGLFLGWNERWKIVKDSECGYILVPAENLLEKDKIKV